MHKFAIISVLIVSTNVCASDLALHADIESGLQHTVDRGDVRAAVVGLYNAGETRVIGLGQLGGTDTRQPTAETVFEIGSVSKVFTALLAQTQVDAGRLGWDEPVSRYFPDVTFASSAVAGITLRELASHTSGLPRLPGNMNPEDPLNPYAGYTDADLVDYLSALQTKALAKDYAYSNLGAGLLGYIAANAVGRSYALAMQRDVLDPLELTDTSAVLQPELRERLAAGFSNGADMPNWSDFGALAGAGAIVSTASDLLAFIRHNLQLDKLPEALLAIRKPQGNGETGLGWHIREIADDGPVYWHNGGTGGYASFLALWPARQSGIVILTTSTEYPQVTELGFAQLGVGESPQTTLDLAPYAGAYRLAPNFVLTVYEEDKQLFGRATGQGAFPLTAKGADEFVFPPSGIRIVFDRTSPGPARRLTFHQAGQTTEAARVADEAGPRQREVIAVDAKTLKDYRGRYRLTNDVVITVMLRGEQLFARLTGQAAYPVFAYDTDRFFFKVVDAQLQFERDGKGAVTSLILHQNGEQRAQKIPEGSD